MTHADQNYRVQVNEIPPNRVVIQEDEPNRVLVHLPGIQGLPGTKILSGAVNPNNGIGRDGDFYVNTATKDFWGPKTDGEWPAEPLYQVGQTLRFVFEQSTPSSAWIIEHPLGGRPSVTVVDSSGTTVFGEVTYVSDTQVTVSFTAPFAGSAYLT